MKLWQFPIYLCMLILLASCDKPPGIPEPDFEESYTPGEISETLTARIYFDATVSMKGFVVPGSTYYTQMLPYLEGIVQSWRSGTAEFYRFGTQVEPIDRTTYLEVAHPKFYDDETINQETRIEQVIDYEIQKISEHSAAISTDDEANPNPDQANPNPDQVNPNRDEANPNRDETNRLAIIVTDLFQEKSDINLLVAQLKEGYLGKNLAVGVLGLRSQFDGIVYDAGINVPPINHQGDRPFYILVLGRHADIAYYFKRFTSSESFSQAQTVLFSQYLVNALVAPEGASIVSTENLTNPGNLVRPPDARLKQFRFRKTREPAEFSATLQYTTLPHTMSFAPDQLEVSVIAQHVPKGRGGPTVESPTARECLEATSKFLENKLTVDGILTPRTLRKGVYLYEFTLSLKGDYQIPDWCSDWDMGLGRDGSKTLNLENFARDLAHVTAQMHQPKIAKFHCYIQKK